MSLIEKTDILFTSCDPKAPCKYLDEVDLALIRIALTAAVYSYELAPIILPELTGKARQMRGLFDRLGG